MKPETPVIIAASEGWKGSIPPGTIIRRRGTPGPPRCSTAGVCRIRPWRRKRSKSGGHNTRQHPFAAAKRRRFRTHRGDFIRTSFTYIHSPPRVAPSPSLCTALYRRYDGKSLIARFRVPKGIANPFSRRRPPETAEFSTPGRFALPFEDSRGCADPITRTQRTSGDRFNLRFVQCSVPRRTFEETWVYGRVNGREYFCVKSSRV